MAGKDTEYDWVKDFEDELIGVGPPPGPEWRDKHDLFEQITDPAVTIDAITKRMETAHRSGKYDGKQYISRTTGRKTMHWRKLKGEGE